MQPFPRIPRAQEKDHEVQGGTKPVATTSGLPGWPSYSSDLIPCEAEKVEDTEEHQPKGGELDKGQAQLDLSCPKPLLSPQGPKLPWWHLPHGEMVLMIWSH